MNEQEFTELAAAAALHALTPDDERRYREAIDLHPEWDAIVRANTAVAAKLAVAIEPLQPPPSIRAALLARVADTPQSSSAQHTDAASPLAAADRDLTTRSEAIGTGRPEESMMPTPDRTSPAIQQPAKRGSGSRRRRMFFALAACLVLLGAVGTSIGFISNFLNRPAAVVALEQIQASNDAQQASITLSTGGSATAHWSPSLGRAVLITDGIDAPPSGQTYELWLVRAETAVPAGTFTPTSGDAIAELNGEMHAGDAIAVTVEQSGGSPTGAPTTPPIFVIPTT